MRRAWDAVKRTVIAFYDDQGTHHAAALTYYALMSMFPMLLLAVSLLGLIGQLPGTYNSIIHYLQGVVPAGTLKPLNTAIRAAFNSKGTALAALVAGVLLALYGSTGYLEATRRALNVVFHAEHHRSFVRRKLTDTASTLLLLALLLVTVVLMFAGVRVVHSLLGPGGVELWRIGRWPAALITALLAFSYIYFVTPDVGSRTFRRVIPGAAVGVTLWLLASAGFSFFIKHLSNFHVTYGSFAAAITLLVWLWLTNVALLLGAEVNAVRARAREAGPI